VVSCNYHLIGNAELSGETGAGVEEGGSCARLLHRIMQTGSTGQDSYMSVTADLITGSLTRSNRGSYPDPSSGPWNAFSATVTASRGPEQSRPVTD
jgi:hypothetical protein